MVAHPHVNGHDVSYVQVGTPTIPYSTITTSSSGNTIWVYSDTGQSINASRPCADCNREAVDVEVTIVAGLSHSGKEHRRVMPIDACIADIVKALDNAGIKMRHSCCGHGKIHGDIILDGGRVLHIKKGLP